MKLFVESLTNERFFRQGLGDVVYNAPVRCAARRRDHAEHGPANRTDTGTQTFQADDAVQAAFLQKGSRILSQFFKMRLCIAKNHWKARRTNKATLNALGRQIAIWPTDCRHQDDRNSRQILHCPYGTTEYEFSILLLSGGNIPA